MRKSFDGLMAIIRDTYQLDPYANNRGETNRGFHIMDMIIRNKHFDEAVFDKITIEDEYKNSG